MNLGGPGVRSCPTVLWWAYIDNISIRANPDNYILCLSFFDMKHLLDIKPMGAQSLLFAMVSAKMKVISSGTTFLSSMALALNKKIY